MTTRSDLALALQHCMDSGLRAAIAVVIETDGSVYRRAGARSVVTEDGRILGIISGGCAEQDLLEHAREIWETGLPKQVSYDFRSPDDLVWGMGAGCNGALKVCLFPFDPHINADLAKRLLAEVKRYADTRDVYTAAMILSSSDATVWPIGPIPDAKLTWVTGKLPELEEYTSLVSQKTWDGTDVEVFMHVVTPRPRLVVVGAGDDAQPLVRFAAQADWHITVIDHRANFVSDSRFPEADVRMVIGRAEYEQVDLDESSFVVVMTHNFELDCQILRNLLPNDFPYVGILGPRRRFERLLQAVQEVGVDLSEAYLLKVHSPIGLDIGAETPEEIALSILAEATARRRNRNGMSLRERAALMQLPEASK